MTWRFHFPLRNYDFKYRRPNGWTDHYQIWHAYADRYGNGSYLEKIDLPPGGGSQQEFRGSKNQSGKCHELPRTGGGVKISK